MKIITKWMSGVAILALGASLAVAAPQPGNGDDAEGHGRFGGGGLAQRLNLTDAQTQQWKTLGRSFHEENRPLLQQFHQTMLDFRAARRAGDTAKASSLEPTLATQRAQVQQLRDSLTLKQLAILNSDQKAQYRDLMARRERREMRRQRAAQ